MERDALDIDLNCDLGEGAGTDDELLSLATSANISCGGHAGDETAIRAALKIARDRGVVVGAHPGYADREHFGRRELDLDEAAIHELCVSQVNRLRDWADAVGATIRYLKPHGALYNQACRDDRFARPVIAAARTLGLPLLALPGSRLEALALDCGSAGSGSAGASPSQASSTGFFREGFADRRYLPDGSLVPRTRPDAFVTDPEEAVAQVRRLIEACGIQSLCVHGDHPEAVAFTRRLREALVQQGFRLRGFA